MTWAAVGLSLLVAAAPAKRRFNVEPFVLGAAGLLGAGMGAWRLVEAEARYRELLAIPAKASTAAEAQALLRQASRLVVRGESESVAGVVLLAAGGALVLASVVWLVVEGFETTDWLVAPGPQGVSVVGRF
jgi:hypothetical protein